MRVKGRDNVSVENGDCLSKMPTATAEQLNIAKMLSKPGDDVDLRTHVQKLQELTECTEDQAVTALYDCENNLQRAVELLLDKFRCGNDEEWHTTGKKSKPKNIPGDADTSSVDLRSDKGLSNEEVRKTATASNEGDTFTSKDARQSDLVKTESWSGSTRKDGRGRKSAVTYKGSNRRNDVSVNPSDQVPVTELNEVNNKGKAKTPFDNETIEEWCPEQSNLPPELFVDTEHSGAKDTNVENQPTSSAPSMNTTASPSLSALPEVDSLFISKALSLTQPCFTKSCPDPESQDFSYAPQSPSKSPTVGFDVNKPNTPRSLLEDPSHPDAKVEQVSSNFANTHFQNVTPVPKTTTAYSSGTKTQQPASFESESGTNQSTFLEPSFKNYLLDGLSSDVSKMSVGEASNTGVKPSQFNLQQPVSQGPQTQSSFSHNQGGAAVSMSSQMSKAPLSHISTHNPLHSSQQPVVSSAAQSQQQSVTLPPGMPHFISQFAPPAYHMFNLPGSSSNAPTLFDLDQLQLFQQQRILYDMHLQHQAATTAQSLLPSTADSTSTSKTSSHNVAGSMGHVTAAGAGIRPDMLASAIGHAPQMLASGHPYFPYSGLVFMNGYTNAFLNQQQQQQPSGQDTNQSQSSTHCGSPITQPQAQSSGQPQSFGGLKQVNAGVGGYDDLMDMKYGDPTKQVGFKNNSNQPNYGSFQTAGASESVGQKLSNAHQSGAGPLTQGSFNTTASGAHTQHFPPQFYPPAATSPYLTAAAVAVAAAAAASVQQQQASVGGGPSSANPNQSNAGGGGNTSGQGSTGGTGTGGTSNASGQLHLTGNPAQPLVLGAAGGGLHHRHHQRSVMPH
ncbi:unnamed protein product [Echinostoma caproni]|uniref:UBA domain-containing protein n=1 Tax=Echinostoma caproni TaxID=27848 RepID=A0A183AMD2_9TREM|nr:unnamed protein product [Echinostoma caproni]